MLREMEGQLRMSRIREDGIDGLLTACMVWQSAQWQYFEARGFSLPIK